VGAIGFIGRFRPPTAEHIKQIKELRGLGYEVFILVDDIQISRSNPFSTTEVENMFRREYPEVEIFEIDLKYIATRPWKLLNPIRLKRNLEERFGNFEVFTRDNRTANFLYSVFGYKVRTAKRNGVSASFVREILYQNCNERRSFEKCLDYLVERGFLTKGVAEEINNERIRRRLILLNDSIRLPYIQSISGIAEHLLSDLEKSILR